MRYLVAALGAAVLFVGCFASVSAQTLEQPSTYSDGFAALHDVLGSKMGLPTDVPNDTLGAVEQPTTEGLAYWLEDTNTPVFFNGVDRWALTGGGIVHWTGDNIQPPLPQAPAIAEAPGEGQTAAGLTPREYLYSQVSRPEADDLNCIITHESHWNPLAKNPHSTASGLAQFLTSTWATTPQGRAGESIWNPYASVDGAIWLYEHVGRTQWEVVTTHLC